MRSIRRIALVILLAVACGALAADWISPANYRRQFREAPNAPPSKQHFLGTDSLGLFGYLGGAWARFAMAVTDLFLSLPWLFLLITVRALLPLNVSPYASVSITFLILGLLGWAASARVLCATALTLRDSSFVLQARASGLRRARVFLVHVLPNLKPVLLAQFWISIPVFILSEANLGVLGLGVTEPLPSWGSLLRELEGLLSLHQEPWKLAPLFLLVLVVTSFQIVLTNEEIPA
jgi:peptide/nickel transport system permease protein